MAAAFNNARIACCPSGDCPGKGIADLGTFAAAVVPALLPLAAVLALSRRGRHLELRLGVFIAVFTLLRDAMTPADLWRILPGPGFGFRLWLPTSPLVLLGLGVASAALVPLMVAVEPALSKYLLGSTVLLGRWQSTFSSVLAGMAGGLAVALPSAALRLSSAGQQPAGAPHCLEAAALPALAAFCLLGNFYEEALFRGFLYGYLTDAAASDGDSRVGSAGGEDRAAMLTALAFCCGHVFLAATVTRVGWPLLAFTLYEGSIAAALRPRGGLLASTVAHGVGILCVALAGAASIGP